MLDVRQVDLRTKPTFLWPSSPTPSIHIIIVVEIIDGDTPLTTVVLAPTHICDRGALLNAQPEGAVIGEFRFSPMGSQNCRPRCHFHDGRTTPHCRRVRDRQFDPRRHPLSSFEDGIDPSDECAGSPPALGAANTTYGADTASDDDGGNGWMLTCSSTIG